MNTTIIVLSALAVIAAAGYFLYWKDSKDDKDEEVLTPFPTPTPLPPVRPTPPQTGPVVEPAPAPAGPRPTPGPVPGPKPTPPPVAPAPKPDPTALYNFAVARKVKKIDFSKLRDIGEVQLGDNRVDRLTNVVFTFKDDASFYGYIAKDSHFNKSVIYLCNSTGRVFGFAISAPGAKAAERKVQYTKGRFKEGAYLVQVSDGTHTGSHFLRPRGN